jgi:ornithine cyclodeaminase
MMGPVAFYGAEEVLELLDYEGCTGAVRDAMISLSLSKVEQPLRTIVELGDCRLFGLMPGSLSGTGEFGAKLVSVFAEPDRPGRSAHRGVVVLFEAGGAVRCIGDAGAITEIRTACASAVATDALARADSRVLALFGTGRQAESHLRALAKIRPLDRVLIWGRSLAHAEDLAERMAGEVGIEIAATSDAEAAAGEADIICTVTAAREPVLLGDWLRPGTHVNLVGSSYLGPVEVDGTLVAKSRYIADCRAAALAAAAEFAKARDSGLVGEDHVAAEIGEVLAGLRPGRTGTAEITVYKSLGHIVQDLAALAYLHGRAERARTSS